MKTLLAIILMIGSSAMAQAQIAAPTQIEQTRDYVGSLLNQLSNVNQANRFSGSSDYAKAGPKLQAEIAERLTQFKAGMESLASGALAMSVSFYNQTAKDSSISEETRKARLESQFKALEIQTNAAQSAYMGILSSLYAIEPSWLIAEVTEVGKTQKSSCIIKINRYTFADGKSVKVVEDKWCDGKGEIRPYIIGRIGKRLTEECVTKFCASSLLADYAFYFSSIVTQFDRDLTITLADGKSLHVGGLSGSSGASATLMNAVSTYSFNTNEFRNLIDRN